MTTRTLMVEGEPYVSLEVLAEIYTVEILWLREVYDCGLLGLGVTSGPHLCVAAVHMDRVATIVRLHHHLGLDLLDIRLELGDLE